ncbi:hypothetical protein BKA62DRAFT_671588 [Auriculariales sp. MPI-PUGE-AT-0066]|nr:hypothetical protein BKA62DRAFT_671588 [Auriculariales sp. MPI-PUGE-AT-0066]
MSAEASPSTFLWYQSVRDRTHNFNCDGSTVCLQVEGRQYTVAKHRLTSISPVFSDLFSLPQTNDAPVVLNHSVEEFESFLGYIYATHCEFAKLKSAPWSQEILIQMLNIASIAHFYQCSDIVKWAIVELREYSQSTTSDSIPLSLLPRLYSFARRASDISSELLDQVRTHWCHLTRSATDPVDWLVRANEVQDEYLQAYAYFHILRLRYDTICAETRLSRLDKQRVTLGSLNLREYVSDHNNCPPAGRTGHSRIAKCPPCRPGHSRVANCPPVRPSFSRITKCRQAEKAPLDHDARSPDPKAPLQDTYGKMSLWDIFNYSPVGYRLDDEMTRG